MEQKGGGFKSSMDQSVEGWLAAGEVSKVPNP